MFLSNPVKIFHAICFLSLLFSGCSLWRGKDNSEVTLASQPKSEFPFTTREPDVFQAEIVVRSGETERRMFTARSGEKRRIDYDVGTDNHRAVLITDKEYLLFFKRKIYVERPMSPDAASQYEPLTAHLLNTRDYSDFDEIGRQGSVIEFRARINESAVSDVTIFFDETIGLPVKEEFYSIEGDQRTLQYSVELRGFRVEAGPELFMVPTGFRRENQTR